MAITRLTRSSIFDILRAEEIQWDGKLEPVAFLSRLFDLESLPSKDSRFSNAYLDIELHTTTFSDWPSEWIYSDNRFNLMGCPDVTFLNFLCLMVNPGVRDAPGVAEHMVDIFNDALRVEGWSIVETRKIGGRPFYQFQPAPYESTDLAITSSNRQLLLPAGFHHLADPYSRFLEDHPDPSNNIFLIMRFNSGRQFTQIHETIRKEMLVYSLTVLRADDKAYTPELWSNICVYMLGCKYGVAVFEEIEEPLANPNVALETGFMLAHNKRCLILKDKRMRTLQTDIIGHLYQPLDTYDIGGSLRDAISKWATDVGLLPF